MHILLCSTYHRSYHYGGNEQYTHLLATGLIAAGHQVSYLCATNTTTAPYQLIPTPLYHLAGKPIPTPQWYTNVLKTKPDLFHATGSGLPLLLAAKAARRLNIPTLLTYQAPTHPQGLMLLPGLIEQALLPLVFDRFITTTPYTRNFLKLRHPQIPTHSIPLCIDPQFFKAQPSQKLARQKVKLPKWHRLILFVGQLSSHHAYKGIPTLLNATRHLPAEYHTILVGSGDKSETYKRLTHKLGISKRVHFAGHVSDTLLPLYYKSADVFVLPSNSNSEGFGLVLLEAMAVGTPTITTTAIAAAGWLKHAGITTLVPPNNPTALAQAIKGQTKNTQGAKLFAKQFTLKNMVKHTLDEYRKALS